jgi:hypothetical protein
MLSIDERIEQNIQRARQEKHRKQAQAARDKKREAAIIRERQQIVGELVTQYFPEILKFNPYRTHAENQREFAPLRRFLEELSFDRKYISMLKEKINREL